MQSLLRNPLAEPYVLGISAGASTGAVAIVILGIGSGAVSLSAGAFAGAFAAFVFVALLSSRHARRGRPDHPGWRCRLATLQRRHILHRDDLGQCAAGA